MIYYINGNRVNPKIAELYAQTNNLKIPKCSRKMYKKNNDETGRETTTSPFIPDLDSKVDSNLDTEHDSDTEHKSDTNIGLVNESIVSEIVSVDLVSDVKEKINGINNMILEKINKFKIKIEEVINENKNNSKKNIDYFIEKISEISNIVEELKLQNRLLDKEIDKVPALETEEINIEKMLEEREKNLQLIKELEAYIVDIKYDTNNLLNKVNELQLDFSESKTNEVKDIEEENNENFVNIFKDEILAKLVDLEEIVEKDKEEIKELKEELNKLNLNREINKFKINNNEKYIEEINDLQSILREKDEEIREFNLREKDEKKVVREDESITKIDYNLKNMIQYMNKKKNDKYKIVDDVNDTMKEKVLTLKEVKKYEDIINEYNNDIKKCEKIIKLMNELK